MIKKVNAIDTSELFFKKKQRCAKPCVTNLVTTVALTSVDNKIPNVSDLVKNADYDAKILEMEKNILLLPMIISSRVIHLMQR